MHCTRQGSNKVVREFVIGEGKSETVNCEYHLKIKWNDQGISIPRGEGNPVRVYFCLKSYENIERKQIK